MRMEFKYTYEGDEELDQPYINGAFFKLYTGITVFIDRESTEYTIEGNTVDMIWKNCYIWNPDTDEKEDVEEDDLVAAKFEGFDIEDDGPVIVVDTLNCVWNIVEKYEAGEL